jgi:hypothetical protein
LIATNRQIINGSVAGSWTPYFAADALILGVDRSDNPIILYAAAFFPSDQITFHDRRRSRKEKKDMGKWGLRQRGLR